MLYFPKLLIETSHVYQKESSYILLQQRRLAEARGNRSGEMVHLVRHWQTVLLENLKEPEDASACLQMNIVVDAIHQKKTRCRSSIESKILIREGIHELDQDLGNWKGLACCSDRQRLFLRSCTGVEWWLVSRIRFKPEVAQHQSRSDLRVHPPESWIVKIVLLVLLTVCVILASETVPTLILQIQRK